MCNILNASSTKPRASDVCRFSHRALKATNLCDQIHSVAGFGWDEKYMCMRGVCVCKINIL